MKKNMKELISQLHLVADYLDELRPDEIIESHIDGHINEDEEECPICILNNVIKALEKGE